MSAGLKIEPTANRQAPEDTPGGADRCRGLGGLLLLRCRAHALLLALLFLQLLRLLRLLLLRLLRLRLLLLRLLLLRLLLRLFDGELDLGSPGDLEHAVDEALLVDEFRLELAQPGLGCGVGMRARVRARAEAR